MQLVWLVWRCTDIADRTQCLNPGNPEFFRLSFCNCISCFCNCNKWSSLHLFFVSNKNPLKGRIAHAADYYTALLLIDCPHFWRQGLGWIQDLVERGLGKHVPQKSTILEGSRGSPPEKFWHPGPQNSDFLYFKG